MSVTLRMNATSKPLADQPAAQHVERDAAADVADVGQALDGRAAEVDRGVAVAQRHEVTDGTGQRVV